MAGRLKLPPPTLDISTTTAGRGPRTGKSISKSAGISRTLLCPRKYSTFSSRERRTGAAAKASSLVHSRQSKGERSNEKTTNQGLDGRGTPGICILESLRHTSFLTPLLRHVRSDQNPRVNRRGPPVRLSGQPCRTPLLSDRARRQTHHGQGREVRRLGRRDGGRRGYGAARYFGGHVPRGYDIQRQDESSSGWRE